MSEAIGFFPAPALSRGLRARLAEDRAFLSGALVDSDGLFAFALFAPMLFIVELGTFGALLFVLVVLFGVWFRPGALSETLRGRSFALAVPAYAALSTLWSDAPLETLKHAIEFAFTVFAGIQLASTRNPKSTVFGLFLAFALYAAASLAAGNTVDVGNAGAKALAGLAESKNEEADIAATGLVISMFVFVIGLAGRSALQTMAAALAGAMQGYETIEAMSAGALAGSAAAAIVLALVLVLRNMGRTVRFAALSFASACALASAALFEASSGDALRWLAAIFGKDPTLTGRTYLWYRARDMVGDHPLWGAGFAAFWRQGNLDAEGLWRYARISTREGFNFHNTLYDALVSLGAVGATIFGVVLAAGAAFLMRRYVRRPSYAACFWIAIGAYFVIRMPLECVGLTEFYFSTALLFAALSSGRSPGGAAWRPIRPQGGSREAGAAIAGANGPSPAL
ncbi:MAG TPA: O-antigen ligase family protein [Rhizomicrobium sp.]|nr:O-antigen ligase family protein [Rhizomicrobium sp.]